MIMERSHNELKYAGKIDPNLPKMMPVNEDDNPPGFWKTSVWNLDDKRNLIRVSLGGGRGYFTLEYNVTSAGVVYKNFPFSDGLYEVVVPWNYAGFLENFAGRPLQLFLKSSRNKTVKTRKLYDVTPLSFRDQEMIIITGKPEYFGFVVEPGIYVRVFIQQKTVEVGTVDVQSVHETGYTTYADVFAENRVMMSLKDWLDLKLTPKEMYDVLKL